MASEVQQLLMRKDEIFPNQIGEEVPFGVVSLEAEGEDLVGVQGVSGWSSEGLREHRQRNHGGLASMLSFRAALSASHNSSESRASSEMLSASSSAPACGRSRSTVSRR